MSGEFVDMIEAKIAQKFKKQYAQLTPIMVLAFSTHAPGGVEGGRFRILEDGCEIIRCPAPRFLRDLRRRA